MTKIMVVDDSRFMRLRLVNLLSEHGYDVVEAADGEEAVQLYSEVRPDAVLMDMAMPRKNGNEALHEIRRLDVEAKVIMLTSMDQQAISIRARQAGAKAFLTKPYESEQVLETLHDVLA